jgi:NAD(P)-binding Rossmann-like domain
MSIPTAPAHEQVDPGSNSARPVAIVGGGITGLFCAYVLASTGHSVELFEASTNFGGRIRSFLLSRDIMNDCAENERNGAPKPIHDRAAVDKLTTKSDEYVELEFCAEFGPMRIELDVQVLLKFLLEHLGILKAPKPKDATSAPSGEDQHQGSGSQGTKESAVTPGASASDKLLTEEEKVAAALAAARPEPFPSFSSPTSEEDPVYRLRPDEEGKNPLELMSLALCRAVVHTSIKDDEPKGEDKLKYHGSKGNTGYKQKHQELINRLRDAAALQEPIAPVFDSWAKKLREDDYWLIARYGCITIDEAAENPTRVPLYTMGFWNLMSSYLSHDALTKIRDLGTFYHLLEENPNAADWFTWQLRQLSISSQLEGIYGGMQAITKNLLTKMGCDLADYDGGDQKSSRRRDCAVATVKFPMFLKAHVSSVTVEGGGLKLEIDDDPRDENDRDATYSRVILALPKAPAQELVTASPDLKHAHNGRPGVDKLTLPDMLDSSFGFPMVKTFFIVRDRWWEEAKRTNRFATRFPTREVHYWKSRDPHSRRGMVMLYTDRPASAFWANYVPAGAQDDVEELCPDGEHNEARKQIRARLKRRLVQYINENHVPDITVDDIIWCGIMDWGRLPYGAGNHAWRPERKFWETMADLGDVTVNQQDGGPGFPIHVCGEAFADYHGFIEGSLRSATYTLTRILKANENHNTATSLERILKILGKDDDVLEALKHQLVPPSTHEVPPEPKPREQDYLEDLRSWVDSLDDSRVQDKPHK